MSIRKPYRGFSLVELLAAMSVLALLGLLAASVVSTAATITTLGEKRMDADSQARQLFDRMAIDFAQMVKRPDVTFYLKGGSGGSQLGGNDEMAFYSGVPGYYSTTTSTTQSPISIVAYHVNAQNKVERMGKGLLWNGVSSTEAPMIFWQPIAAPTSTDYTTAGEVAAPQVFRLEYSYLLTDGTSSITLPASISGIAALIVDIAVIDSQSKAVLSDSQITALIPQLIDSSGVAAGRLLGQWQGALDANTNLARSAISNIRLYERYFYLSSPAP